MIAPRHPCRPKMRRRDYLSLIVIVVSLAAIALPVVISVSRAIRPACAPDFIAPCDGVLEIIIIPERP